MDFLRRLAPPGQHDAARAAPLLPSRFAAEGPLRSVPTPAQPDDHPGEDDAMAEPAPARMAAAWISSPTPPVPAEAPDTRHASREFAATPSARAARHAVLPRAANIHRAGAAVAPSTADLHAVDPAPARQNGREPQRPAAPTAGQRAQPAPAPAPESRQAAPLTPGILAQRVAGPGREQQVVHVTIGRIDVVASVAPPPAAARAPKRAAESAPLADYLRGRR